MQSQMRQQMRRQEQVRSEEVRSEEVRGQEVRSEMRPQVRAQELMGVGPMRHSPPTGSAPQAAGLRLLEIYAGLARRGEHLLGRLLGGELPRQWRHYPGDDAVDPASGFQWFYHSHSPQDRPDAAEHGHIHLFARRKLWSRRLRSAHEIDFARLADDPARQVSTRHLIAIGLDAKGIPISLFTVNSWVTGDLMLSAATTALLLEQMTLDTGNEDVDALIECIVRLYKDEIRDLLLRRDALLCQKRAPGVLDDERLEVLSEASINVDGKLACGANSP
jgi:hypothetical protein